MKTIIEKNNGYAVVEWIAPPEINIPSYIPYGMLEEEYRQEIDTAYIRQRQEDEEWKAKLHSQPSVQVHPSHTQWAKENLYQPVEDDRIEIKWHCNRENGATINNIPVGCSCMGAIIEEKKKDCPYGQQYALPKQPVEVKEDTIIVTEQTDTTELTVNISDAALPVEKEGESMWSTACKEAEEYANKAYGKNFEDLKSHEFTSYMFRFIYHLQSNFTLTRKKKD